MNGDATTPISGLQASPARRSADGPTFAHASEAELARILDFYAVRWEYEPHVFPILWNLDGVVVESFSPDFYLPDFDTYLELTTLRQPLVRKKNRKLRRLRELYPDIGIKLFYARDFRALMLKYGKLGLVDALSGTSGQVLPPGAQRDDEADVADVSDAPDELARDPLSATIGALPGTADRSAIGAIRPVAVSAALRRARRRRRRSVAALTPLVTGPDA